ncbi:MAG TPA: hypothetical protein VKT78_16275 [Fimbriimonadaceae bacterium]|nr:hypothetical protein [Fimbriimonadaceae bacterium]
MNRPSKKQIKAALEKLHDTSATPTEVPYLVPKLEAKKSNKNRIRKKGV